MKKPREVALDSNPPAIPRHTDQLTEPQLRFAAVVAAALVEDWLKAMKEPDHEKP